MDTNMHARDPRLNATKGYTGTLGMGEQARERERLEHAKRQRIQADLEIARQRQFAEK